MSKIYVIMQQKKFNKYIKYAFYVRWLFKEFQYKSVLYCLFIVSFILNFDALKEKLQRQ